jgi:hypothetical protein
MPRQSRRALYWLRPRSLDLLSFCGGNGGTGLFPSRPVAISARISFELSQCGKELRASGAQLVAFALRIQTRADVVKALVLAVAQQPVRLVEISGDSIYLASKARPIYQIRIVEMIWAKAAHCSLLAAASDASSHW